MKHGKWAIRLVFTCLVALCLAGGQAKGQQLLEERYIHSMMKDLTVLASDSLEGREAGSLGELLAALYIAERFELLDIKPWFTGCYYHDFDFADGLEYGPSDNHLRYSMKDHEPGTIHEVGFDRFIPLPWGRDGEVSGTVVDAGHCLEGYRKKGGAGKKAANLAGGVFLVRFDQPDKDKKTIPASTMMHMKAKHAEEMGAAAVIFWDPDQKTTLAPGAYIRYDSEPVAIPVLFLKDAGIAREMVGQAANVKVSSSKRRSFGKNVAGWIDNGAEKSIIIGAHIDHLGYGGYNSRNEGLPAIHYGADDNASGVAGMLALAEWLKTKGPTNRNYILVGFSAEEKGLIGSRIFAEQEGINPDNILCMLNFDMIGRVSRENPEIRLLASGSSPSWEPLLSHVTEDVKGVPVTSGVNGSDHYHFYKNGIPVLFFFNGIHEDYHKPSDSREKINFQGLRDVVEYSIHLLRILDTVQVLPFSDVSGEQSSSRRGGKISLGIVPAHGTDADGVPVGDVIPLKPAAMAGMLKGDTIVKVGDLKVSGMVDYMRGLDQLETGQKVEVWVERDGKTLKLQLQL